MNDKRFRITLNIDAEVSQIPPAGNGRPSLLPIEIDVSWDEQNPGQSFCMAAKNYPGLITGKGPDLKIDLGCIDRRFPTEVLLRFKLMDATKLHFPADPSKAFGIQVGDECPDGPCNENSSVFKLRRVTNDMLALRITQADSKDYRFALFLDRSGQPVSLDPRIINK